MASDFYVIMTFFWNVIKTSEWYFGNVVLKYAYMEAYRDPPNVELQHS